MTFTLTVSDILLLVLTLTACVVAFALVRALRDIQRVVGQLSKTLEGIQSLSGKLQHLSDESERTVVSLRRFSDEGYAVVGDLAATTAKVRSVVEEGAEQVRDILTPMKYISLLVAGLKAGFETYSKIRDRNAGDEDPSDQEGGTP